MPQLQNPEKRVDLRIREHPVLEFERGKPVHLFLQDEKIEAYPGETVAAALYASGVKVYSKSVKYGRPRGFFCGIGKCSSCLMRVDGIPHARICIEPVKDQMRVSYEENRGEIPASNEIVFEEEKITTDLVVVGGGPAGLSAAVTAANLGVEVLVVDENPSLGGQLIKQTHKFFGSKSTYAGVRGVEIAKILLDKIRKVDAEFACGTSVIGHHDGKKHLLTAVQDNRRLLEIRTDEVIVATGARENVLLFPNNDLPGIYCAGGVQTLMNVYGIKPGNEALIVGAGNVGLIVGYQLIQAGVDLKMIVEAAPKIGGYLVHASKLRRLGVPILTRHTIKKAEAKDHVERVTIVELDENWEQTEGTEQEVDVDLVCVAVGLTPSSELLFQAGCKQVYMPELGGQVAVHNEDMETTVEGVYLAGDVSGIEEANTAMMEGRISGAKVAAKHGKNRDEAERIRKESLASLKTLRASAFSERVLTGKEKIFELWRRTT
jgi:sarcosine oxidase subunit alpha